MDNRFSLYVDDINDKHYSFTLTESQYKKLDSVINVYWKRLVSDLKIEDYTNYEISKISM